MKIIFLGSFPTTKLIKDSNGTIDSLYRDDHAIIEGLRQQPDVEVNVITMPDIPSYPKQKLYFKGYYDSTDDVRSLSLLNIPVIKQFWTVVALYFAAIKVVKSSKETIFVFVPYIVLHHTLPARMLKKKYGDKVKVVTVVPDIFFPKSRLSKLLNLCAERNTSHGDAFIFYTEYMKDYLGVAGKPYLVIEGFQAIRMMNKETDDGVFRIVYCGSLNLNYGVGRLVDAMGYVNEPVELHLYGTGSAVEYIQERCKKDKRIIFHGKVSKAEAQRAVSGATVLVNPRNATDGEYVNYSFPSKDIEYLGSGIPAILCKLPGMPKEYYSFFIDAKEGKPEELAEAIKLVYGMSKVGRRNLGQKAYEFIKERMDVSRQGEKIIDLFTRNI